MSYGNLQYQQNQPNIQQQLQHPLLAATSSGNDYVYGQVQLPQPQPQQPQQERAHFLHPDIPTYNQFQSPYTHYSPVPPFKRPLTAASSNLNGIYASSGHSGYGMEPSEEYEYHQPGPPPLPSSHSGGYSYPAPTGTGYAVPPAHPPVAAHPPPTYDKPTSSKKKRGGSSTMTALTLLSFFFFVNLLQNCIKDHMDAINPTVMVLTANGVRSRFNKLAEMNSREQTSSPASTTNSFAWSAELVPAAASAEPSVVVPAPTVKLQSAYSSNSNPFRSPQHSYGANYNSDDKGPQNNYIPSQQQHAYVHNNQEQPSTTFPYTHRVPFTDLYTDSKTTYPNHTLASPTTSLTSVFSDQNRYQTNNYDQHHFQPQPQHQPPPHSSHTYSQEQQQQAHYASSYGGDAVSSPGSYKRYSSAPWSSASLSAQSGVSTYFDDADADATRRPHRRPYHAHQDSADYDVDDDHYRSGDKFYTRIN